MSLSFFFQAEDGIRDHCVTGVQTCALPISLSKNAARVLKVFFAFVVVFLYAPILILLIFSFNDSDFPAFPLTGFTLHWYHEFLTNPDLKGALETSAIVAALSSICAVLLGVLASIVLVRRRFLGKAAVSALILPAVVSAFLIAFTTSFDEYAVASFVVGTRTTFPIFLYSALRFPNQLPQVIAVAVVVIVVSLIVVIGAELGRRVVERRLEAL